LFVAVEEQFARQEAKANPVELDFWSRSKSSGVERMRVTNLLSWEHLVMVPEITRAPAQFVVESLRCGVFDHNRCTGEADLCLDPGGASPQQNQQRPAVTLEMTFGFMDVTPDLQSRVCNSEC